MPPYDGSGNFTVYTPGNPRVAGTTIAVAAINNTNSDFATGLTNVITRDGQSPPTANLPMGGFKFTGLADPSSAQDSATKAYVDAQRVTQTVKDLSVGAVSLFDWSLSVTGARKITGAISGMSTNGNDAVVIQIGTGGSPETAGYLGSSGSGQAAGTVTTFTGGFYLYDTGIPTRISHGTFTLVLLDSSTNTWAFSSVLGASNGALLMWTGGSKSLAGTLDLIRIRTLSTGTDKFDAGKANLIVEY